MSSTRFDLNKAGLREAALVSQEVRDKVAAAAEAAAADARKHTNNEVITVHAGKSRARSYVRMLGADAALVEARDRVLGRAIGAAGGS